MNTGHQNLKLFHFQWFNERQIQSHGYKVKKTCIKYSTTVVLIPSYQPKNIYLFTFLFQYKTKD